MALDTYTIDSATQEIFTVRLQAAMKAANMNVYELTGKIGVQYVESVQRWINGKSTPRLLNFAAICYALDVTPNYLLGFDGMNQKGSEQNGQTCD